MTRATLIASMWLVLIGSIIDRIKEGSSLESLNGLLVLGAVVTLATAAAMWIQFDADDSDEVHPHYD